MYSFRSGDLVYLPSKFVLTKYNNDGTVSQYCEIKEPCVCILLKSAEQTSEVFYRGQTWTANNEHLNHYTQDEGEENVGYTC